MCRLLASNFIFILYWKYSFSSPSEQRRQRRDPRIGWIAQLIDFFTIFSCFPNYSTFVCRNIRLVGHIWYKAIRELISGNFQFKQKREGFLCAFKMFIHVRVSCTVRYNDTVRILHMTSLMFIVLYHISQKSARAHTWLSSRNHLWSAHFCAHLLSRTSRFNIITGQHNYKNQEKTWQCVGSMMVSWLHGWLH